MNQSNQTDDEINLPYCATFKISLLATCKKRKTWIFQKNTKELVFIFDTTLEF